MATIRGTILEIAERGVRLVKEQGTTATNDEGHCLYRNAKGDRCIVGLLVSEDEAQSFADNFGGFSVSSLDIDYPDIDTEWEADLMLQLQDVHDNVAVAMIKDPTLDLGTQLDIEHAKFLESVQYAAEMEG